MSSWDMPELRWIQRHMRNEQIMSPLAHLVREESLSPILVLKNPRWSNGIDKIYSFSEICEWVKDVGKTQ